MARTKSELSTAVLRELGVVDALHSPAAVDAAFVEERYDDRLEEMKDKGLVYWPNTGRATEEIPNVVFRSMVLIMVAEVAPSYGYPIPTSVDDRGRPIPCGTKGLMDLRRHLAKGPSGAPTRATYY